MHLEIINYYKNNFNCANHLDAPPRIPLKAPKFEFCLVGDSAEGDLANVSRNPILTRWVTSKI